MSELYSELCGRIISKYISECENTPVVEVASGVVMVMFNG
jgi:hypothetical protein